MGRFRVDRLVGRRCQRVQGTVAVVIGRFRLRWAQKYHSIHQSGKRLEDVLTEEELKELREYVFLTQKLRHGIDVCSDYGDLMEEAEAEADTASGAADTHSVADRDNTEILYPQIQANGPAQAAPTTSPMQVRGRL